MDAVPVTKIILTALPEKERKINYMPLYLANIGEENIVRRIGGSVEVKKHLEHLGFVAGSTVTVVSSMGGNLIVNIKDSRIAISREMAMKIMI